MFILAPNSFYPHSYDDVTQGPGKYSSKIIDTQGAIHQVIQRTKIQRMSLNKPWGHCIDDQATIQKSPTALTINLDHGYVLGSTPLSNWIEVQEGKFLGCSQVLGASFEDVGWVTTGFLGVQPPFFIIPICAFKLAFWPVLMRSCGQSFTRWSGLPHLKQFQFFFWYSLTMLARQMMYPSNWSGPATPSEVLGSSPSEDSTSSAFVPKSSVTPLLSTIANQTVKVWLPFNFQDGNKFLDVA